MAPLPRSPILSALARTRLRQPAIQQLRTQEFSIGRARPPRYPIQWASHAKKLGGTAKMYFPVVGLVMFWPLVAMPVIDAWRGV